MPTITLSATTYRRLARYTAGGFKTRKGRRRHDGTWRVPVSAETYRRLQKCRRPGESIEAVVLRGLADLDRQSQGADDDSDPDPAA